GYKVIIFAGSEERAKGLQAALMDLGLVTSYVEDYEHEIKSSQIFISPGSINRGFEYPDIKFAAISHKEIFKSTKDSRRVKKKSKGEVLSFSDLKIGDYVVHENHGICQYGGIEKLKIQGVIKDYLTINYRGNDKLYVPIDQMNLIQKYVGGEGTRPKVNKLSSSEWAKAKQRA